MRRALFIGSVLALAALSVVFARTARVQPLPALPVAARVGAIAPDFEMCDLRGKSWRLRRLVGTPVLLVFACGCGDCAELLRTFSTRRVPHVIVVATSAPIELDLTIRRAGARFPVLLDAHGRVATAYSTNRCPHVWAIDSRQVIRYTSEATHRVPTDVVWRSLRSVRAL